MAHNIAKDKLSGEHSFVTSGGKKAWHGLGTVVQDAMTSAECIQLAHLDYEIRKSKTYVRIDEDLRERGLPQFKGVPNKYATYRADTGDVFGSVGSTYEVVQNLEAFMFMDSIVGEGKAIYETAGALGNGNRVFITAKLPYYINIGGHDTIENYLVVSLGHDGNTPLKIFLTPVRIVCQNTLSYGLSVAKFKISLRHTKNIHDKLEDATELLHISKSITEDMQDVLTHLSKVKVTDEQVGNYYNKLFLNDEELSLLARYKVGYDRIDAISTKKVNVLNEVNNFYHSGIGQKNILGSAYGAYNGFTGYLSNVKKYKSESDKMSNLVIGGSDHTLNNKAFELIMDTELLTQ